MIKTSGKDRLSRVFSDLVTAGLVWIVILIQINNSRSLGGSYAIFYLALSVQFLRISFKTFRQEINTISHILLLLTLSNYVASLEATSGVSNKILLVASALVTIIVILTSKTVIWPYRAREIDNESSSFKIEIRKRVFEITAIRPVAIAVFYTTISAAIISGLLKVTPHFKTSMRFSCVVLFWLAVALSIGLRGARKIPEDYFFYLANRKERLNAIFFRKFFLYISVGTLLIGTFIEIAIRGLLLMWFISWLVILLILLLCWQTWRCVSSDKEVDISGLSPDALPSVLNPKIAFRFIAINILAGSIYSFILVLFWYFYWR